MTGFEPRFIMPLQWLDCPVHEGQFSYDHDRQEILWENAVLEGWRVFTHVYIFLYIFIYFHICLYMFIYVYICLYMFIYIYMS